MNEKDEKLLIFGWIVTILEIEGEVALNENTRNKVIKLVDKLYDVFHT